MGTKNNPGMFDCYDAAEPDEPMFVLLARDVAAPYLVRLWANERRELHRLRDTYDERQQAKVEEALACADAMEQWWEDR